MGFLFKAFVVLLLAHHPPADVVCCELALVAALAWVHEVNGPGIHQQADSAGKVLDKVTVSNLQQEVDAEGNITTHIVAGGRRRG